MKKKSVGMLLGALLLALCAGQAKQAQAAQIHTNTLQGAEQVVVAETDTASSSYAVVTAYEENGDGNWVAKRTTSAGRVGAKGIVPIPERQQSTKTTPEGVLKLLAAYGTAADPGALFPYHKITNNMYWNLNSGSSTYNQLVYKNPGGDYEHLIQYKTYRYLFTTDYNTEQIANKGGAIFLHCNGSGATGGCVSVPESDMTWLMRWLDPAKNPALIVTTTADKSTYFVPETPRITAIAQTDGTGVTISWQKADGAAYYQIQRAAADGQDYQTIAVITNPDATAWTDADGTADACYRIAAGNNIDGQAGYTAISGALSVQVPFTDVSPSAYYRQAVAWAIKNGVTAGTAPVTFSPDSACTRSQILQFIWRGVGSPAAGPVSVFSDVSPDAWYCAAVQWGVANGITAGTSATTFSPDAVCTRAEAMMFLWKSAGMPQPSDNAPVFQDISSSDYYYTAVRWAAEHGITSGTGGGMFSPNSTCTRAQIITFLFHVFAK